LIDIQAFYETIFYNSFHLKIAEIPFHLIISVSPDHIFKNLFSDKKINHSFDFYNKESNPLPLESPTKQKPLIYNLFGDIDSEGSLIFTYEDLFEYLISIFGKFELPQELQKQLLLARLVLFIGFKLDKWYFKLLLRLLKLHENKLNNASDKNKTLLPIVKNFYAEEFKMKFLDFNETEIINNIYDKCKEKNILKKIAPEAPAIEAEVFISYGWQTESEEIAGQVYSVLKEKGFNVKLDKIELAYKGNIKEFMRAIGRGKYVVVIISDKYLKSENCMFEMLEISRNNNAYNRIFPIVLEDAAISDTNKRIGYLKYWDEKIEALNASYRTIDPVGTNEVVEKINQYNDIRRVFSNITDMLGNMNTLTAERLHIENFSPLISKLNEQIKEDDKTTSA